MNVSSDALGVKLERELGAASVQGDAGVLGGHAVDGKSPALVCFPSAAEQVRAILRLCGEVQAAVTPWGGGTAMRQGNIPSRVDVVVVLERLAEVVEHDDANLTATAQAGMKVAALQEIVGRRRQHLAVDPPHPARATLGGIVAANSNGPRRMLHGGLRDLVIGMKMVVATGEQIKAGGKVVKNVAGYDLCKLFVGSLGTLGIVTEVTFRMAPLPESAASFLASGPLARCVVAVERILSSPLLPAAVTMLSSRAAKRIGCDSEMPVVAIGVEGFEESVARHFSEMEAIARQADLVFEPLRDEPHRRLWERIANFSADETGILYRITVPVGAVAEILATVERWSNGEHPARYVADAGSGTVWLALDAKPGDIEGFVRLAALAREHGGHAAIAAAPAALKAGIDVWGEAPASMNLMREIKRRFDPNGILNPGRFLGGM
jgi:glycolate oxidase FAD binding subunit